MLSEIWARTGGAGEKHPVWRLVEGLLRMALDRVGTVPVPAASDHPEQISHDRAP